MYFDPGSGSIIIQILLAALATISTLFVAFKAKIVSFFTKKKNKKKDDKNEE
jgi:hypothetical protein